MLCADCRADAVLSPQHMLGSIRTRGFHRELKIDVYFDCAALNQMRQEILTALHSTGRYPTAVAIPNVLVSQWTSSVAFH